MEDKKLHIWRYSPMQIFRLILSIIALLSLVTAFILLLFFPHVLAKIFNFFTDNLIIFFNSLNILK